MLLQQFDAADDALHAQNTRRRTRTDVVDDQTTFRQSVVDARHVTLDRPRRRLCQDITRHTARRQPPTELNPVYTIQPVVIPVLQPV